MFPSHTDIPNKWKTTRNIVITKTLPDRRWKCDRRVSSKYIYAYMYVYMYRELKHRNEIERRVEIPLWMNRTKLTQTYRHVASGRLTCNFCWVCVREWHATKQVIWFVFQIQQVIQSHINFIFCPLKSLIWFRVRQLSVLQCQCCVLQWAMDVVNAILHGVMMSKRTIERMNHFSFTNERFSGDRKTWVQFSVDQ